MDREIKTALGAAAGISGLVIAFIFLFRYAVPAVLEAPFSGSLITASVLGITGILVLVWAGSRLWAWAINSLKR